MVNVPGRTSSARIITVLHYGYLVQLWYNTVYSSSRSKYALQHGQLLVFFTVRDSALNSYLGHVPETYGHSL